MIALVGGVLFLLGAALGYTIHATRTRYCWPCQSRQHLDHHRAWYRAGNTHWQVPGGALGCDPPARAVADAREATCEDCRAAAREHAGRSGR